MNEEDIAAFRLRAFEADWIAPLFEKGWPHAGLGIGGTHKGNELMRTAFKLEGACWLDMGERLGAFSAISELPNSSLARNIRTEEFRSHARKALAPYFDLTLMEEPSEYKVSGLRRGFPSDNDFPSYAFVGLTLERLSYISLLLFADEKMWAHRMGELRSIVDQVSRAPWSTYSSHEADGFAWALSGRSPNSSRLSLPLVGEAPMWDSGKKTR